MSDDILITLRKRTAKAPDSPGIYKWMNAEGTVLYVGKAKNLKNRLKSYVNKGAEKGLGPWKLSLLKQIADFDVTVVNSEVEALVLETNLIKELRPKYNVMMKDDKNYVYVQITVQDPFPRVEVVRRIEDPKARSFGPFISAFDTRRSLDMLNELFSYRACKASIDALNRAKGDQEAVYGTGKLRPCLDYQIGQCNGLCAAAISQDEYRARLDHVIHFFKGDYKPVIERARELMMQAASEKKFERASKLRDLLQVVENMQEKQIVSDTSGENADVIGLALLSGKVQVVIMQKREGKLIGEQQFGLAGSAESMSEVLEQFLPQYYESIIDLPDAVIIGEDFEDRKIFEEYLTKRRGKNVKVIVPERGAKSQLLKLAETNAHQKATQAEASWEADQRNTEAALEELARILDLKAPPKRIEGYDISHTGGAETVGSMVVFCDGKPKNDFYRSFTIHSMRSGVVDDYRALKEVLTRRLRHTAGGLHAEEEQWNENGVTFRKAHKDEDGIIHEIIERHPRELSQSDLSYKQFLVALHEGNIVAFARLREHDGKLLELSSLWVEEEFRGGKLGQFLARKLLHSLKKGKVYVRVGEALEQYYASVGFRHVLKSPEVFQKRWEAYKKEHPDAVERLVMVYDTLQHKPDVSLSAEPDLIVIDGGKGQLGVGIEVLKNFELDIPVIGLAKREEEVFVPGKSVSVLFPSDSPAKFLLMRLRDEAHRFANRHRQKRAIKSAVQSQLDRIPSIGPETKQRLLKQFGSVDGVKRAPDEQLQEILTSEQIRGVREFL
jgi:excinuclease ABC subunit C